MTFTDSLQTGQRVIFSAGRDATWRSGGVLCACWRARFARRRTSANNGLAKLLICNLVMCRFMLLTFTFVPHSGHDSNPSAAGVGMEPPSGVATLGRWVVGALSWTFELAEAN